MNIDYRSQNIFLSHYLIVYLNNKAVANILSFAYKDTFIYVTKFVSLDLENLSYKIYNQNNLILDEFVRRTYNHTLNDAKKHINNVLNYAVFL